MIEVYLSNESNKHIKLTLLHQSEGSSILHLSLAVSSNCHNQIHSYHTLHLPLSSIPYSLLQYSREWHYSGHTTFVHSPHTSNYSFVMIEQLCIVETNSVFSQMRKTQHPEVNHASCHSITLEGDSRGNNQEWRREFEVEIQAHN